MEKINYLNNKKWRKDALMAVLKAKEKYIKAINDGAKYEQSGYFAFNGSLTCAFCETFGTDTCSACPWLILHNAICKFGKETIRTRLIRFSNWEIEIKTGIKPNWPGEGVAYAEKQN